MRISLFALGLTMWLGAFPGERPWHAQTKGPQEQLSTRIPAADPAKYRSIRDARDWLNPGLIIHGNAVWVISQTIPSGRKLVPTDELRRTLVSLPVGAWPYGRVVEASDAGIRSAGDDESIKRNHQAVQGRCPGSC
jgi:hypothetical protein